MKKIVLPVVILLLIIVSLVQAKMTPISRDGYNYQVKVYLEKGWNLVLNPWELDSLFKDSEIKTDDIRVGYFFVHRLNKYVEIYPNNNVNEEINNIDFPEGEFAHLSVGSAWIYSDKSGYIEYSRVDVPKYHQSDLYSGWNFFTLLPEMKGKTLGELKGNCNIVKYAFWQHNEWTVVDIDKLQSNSLDTPNGWERVMLAESDQDIGKGILFKVQKDCELGENTMTPPAIPD